MKLPLCVLLPCTGFLEKVSQSESKQVGTNCIDQNIKGKEMMTGEKPHLEAI